MLPRSEMSRTALAGPHRVTCRAEVWYGGEKVLADLPLIDGSVRATLSSRVARVLDVVLPGRYFPTRTLDPVTPFGSELRVWRGMEMGSHYEEWQIFRGRIQSVKLGDDDLCRVAAVDRAGDILDAGFEAPYSTGVISRVTQEAQTIITEAIEDAEFGPHFISDAQVPELTWEEDRAKALDDLLGGVGAFWYPLADGTFVFRTVPWTYEQDPAYVLTTASEAEAGTYPTITSTAISYDRSGVYNSVTVNGERTDGAPPVRWVARDSTAGSPTYFRGAFGLRARQIRVQSAVNAGQARSVAMTRLRQGLALNRSWAVTVVADPAIELGDVVEVRAKGRRDVQVISGFTLPLFNLNMPLTLRALVPEGESVADL